MRMIGHQRPSIDIRSCFQGNRPHSGYEYSPIFIVGNDLSFFYPPDNHMMQRARRIESWTSRHASNDWLVSEKVNAAFWSLQVHDFRNVPKPRKNVLELHFVYVVVSVPSAVILCFLPVFIGAYRMSPSPLAPTSGTSHPATPRSPSKAPPVEAQAASPLPQGPAGSRIWQAAGEHCVEGSPVPTRARSSRAWASF